MGVTRGADLCVVLVVAILTAACTRWDPLPPGPEVVSGPVVVETRSNQVYEFDEVVLEGDSVLIGRRSDSDPERIRMGEVVRARRQVSNVAGSVLLGAGVVGAGLIWLGLRQLPRT